MVQTYSTVVVKTWYHSKSAPTFTMYMQDAIYEQISLPPFCSAKAIATVTIDQNMAANAIFKRWSPVLCRAEVWPSWEAIHAFEQTFDWEAGGSPTGTSILHATPGASLAVLFGVGDHHWHGARHDVSDEWRAEA